MLSLGDGHVRLAWDVDKTPVSRSFPQGTALKQNCHSKLNLTMDGDRTDSRKLACCTRFRLPVLRTRANTCAPAWPGLKGAAKACELRDECQGAQAAASLATAERDGV